MKNQQAKKEYIICNICGENLGEDRPNWAVEHLKNTLHTRATGVYSNSIKM